jgi:hypothetical protein
MYTNENTQKATPSLNPSRMKRGGREKTSPMRMLLSPLNTLTRGSEE